MSRSDCRHYEREEREVTSEPSKQGNRASGGEGGYDSGEVTAGRESPHVLSRQREPIQTRNAVLQVSPAEHSTLETIGKFRVLRSADLLRYHYGGEGDLMRLDLDDLKSQGLIREERSMATLTKQGAQLVEQQQKPGGRQTIYHGFTTTYSYNCAGGVVLQVTDPNGAVTQTGYSDPYYWRPATSTDSSNNVTNYTYYPTLGTVGQVESVMAIPYSSSAVDTLSTPDSFGRPWLAQTRQAPGSPNFDTVQNMYGASGRVRWVLRPFSSSAGLGSIGGLPATGYTYDALGRATDVTDWSGVHSAYVFRANDVKVSISPAPAKSMQYEYDALGRLSSVCEITTATTAGCGQNLGGTGYKTAYTYDPLGNLLTAKQPVNLTAYQTRTFTYNGLGRMLSEQNPENGTVSYTYDPVTGDNLTKVDAGGTHTTSYVWDSLHRLAAVYYSGAGTSSMPAKWFYYDKDYGFSSVNVKGRLANTQTYIQSTSTYTTSEAFSYSSRGEITDFYEWTQHSNGWYHVQQGYFANGAPASLRGYLGTGTTTPFSHDIGFSLGSGEGRLYGFYDSTAANTPWPLTAYNVAGQPTQVNLIGGAESFQYDANSGRMTQWQSTAGSNTQTGNLTWNANGTLGSMVTHDTYNPNNDNKTCTYDYDDLWRLKDSHCGAIWSQDFTYDPFGNIVKTGTSRFDVLYEGTTNHVIGQTYDSNGSVTNDGAHTYAYDVDNRPTTADGVVTLFDAFGRAVEQNHSGTYSQIVYSPTGSKFAFMSGRTLQTYLIPLVGGMQAVYNSTGLQFYRHADWLGSSRFDSTPTAGVYFDGGWAPFGETYAGMGTSDRVFTGQTRDTITNSSIYDFLFRQYDTVAGRWKVPDPAGIAAVDVANPQTWNRYAYVGNNPLSNVDPLGLDEDQPYPIPWGSLFCGGDPIICALGGRAFCVFAGLCSSDGSGGGNGGDSGGGSSSGPPPTTPPKPVNFPKETNGIPNGLNANFGGPLGAIIPSATCGDLGPCDPIGFGFTGSNGPYHCDFLGNCYRAPSDWYLPIRLFGSHWCGHGGAGRTLSGLDAACKAHDACYDTYKLSAGSNWWPLLSSQQQGALQACNQQLCNAARSSSDPGATRVNLYFTYIVPNGNCQ